MGMDGIHKVRNVYFHEWMSLPLDFCQTHLSSLEDNAPHLFQNRREGLSLSKGAELGVK